MTCICSERAILPLVSCCRYMVCTCCSGVFLLCDDTIIFVLLDWVDCDLTSDFNKLNLLSVEQCPQDMCVSTVCMSVGISMHERTSCFAQTSGKNSTRVMYILAALHRIVAELQHIILHPCVGNSLQYVRWEIADRFNSWSFCSRTIVRTTFPSPSVLRGDFWCEDILWPMYM